MRILIADDELPARQRLRQLLVAHPEHEVVAEAENGAQTMELVSTLRPDLLFLDIQMTQGTGLDVAACLPTPRPAIIFCTAFDQFAVDAFELNALDYLLKPVSRVRLDQTLARACQRIASDTNADIDLGMQAAGRPLSRFLVHSGTRYLVIPLAEVSYCESVDGLTRLVTSSGKEYWMDPSIQELESRVDATQFFRISRSVLVSLSAVREIHPLPGGNAELLIGNGTRLDVSRRRLRDLLSKIEKG